MSVSRWQATAVVGTEGLTTLVLFSYGSVLLWESSFGSCTTPAVHNSDDVLAILIAVSGMHILVRLLGLVLIVYAGGVAVWIAPLLQDCLFGIEQPQPRQRRRIAQPFTSYETSAQSIQGCRAAAVSTSLLGLGLVVVSVFCLDTLSSATNSSNSTNYNSTTENCSTAVMADLFASADIPNDTNDWSLIVSSMLHRLSWILESLGMIVLVLSSTSLMISCWPTSTFGGAQQQPTATPLNRVLGARLPPLAAPPELGSGSGDIDSLIEPLLQKDPTLDTTSISSLHDADCPSDHRCRKLLADNDDNTHGIMLPQSASTTVTANHDHQINGGMNTVVVIAENGSDAPANHSDPPERRSRGSTRRLLQLAASQVLYLYAGCAVLVCRLPFSLAMPHFVSTTLAAVAAADFVAARREIQILFLAGSIDALLDFWAFFLFGYANQRIVRGLRVDLFRRLLGQEMAFFDSHSSGELASRLNSDCSEMAGDLTWFFRFSIESVVRIVGITSYMLWRSPILAGCALCIIPVVATINKFYGDWLRTNAVGVQDALAEANGVAQEALSNVRTVIAFVAEDIEFKRYESRIDVQFQLNLKQLYMTALYYMGTRYQMLYFRVAVETTVSTLPHLLLHVSSAVSTFLINTVVQGVLLWFGTTLIEEGKLTPGVLLAFMLYQSQLQNETLSLMNSYTSLIKSSGAGDKVFALLDRSPPPPSTAHALDPSPSISHALETATANYNSTDGTVLGGSTLQLLSKEVDDIEKGSLGGANMSEDSQYNVRLENLYFAYPGRPENPVLVDFSLDIPRGQTVALVGRSGCGKTTIVNLLQRFYDPSRGRVMINGIDLRQLDLMEHRRRVGVVTQDPALFRGTLRENILYGSYGNTDDDVITTEMVERAARLAHADAFIRQFPYGLETETGERGVQLSGGQKQRIGMVICTDGSSLARLLSLLFHCPSHLKPTAIARAIVVPHSLLILDEATSSLDTESETAVQEALDQLLEQHSMTTIVIAHRLRTVKNADKIVVLESGRVIEEGTHEELIQRTESVYRNMVERAGESGKLPEV
jgi:ABC-type multidrug transport system fused ATPase/permease subunit